MLLAFEQSVTFDVTVGSYRACRLISPRLIVNFPMRCHLQGFGDKHLLDSAGDPSRQRVKRVPTGGRAGDLAIQADWTERGRLVSRKFEGTSGVCSRSLSSALPTCSDDSRHCKVLASAAPSGDHWIVMPSHTKSNTAFPCFTAKE